MKTSRHAKQGGQRLGFESIPPIQQIGPGNSTDLFAGQESHHAARMRADIRRVARRPYNILITGETGTGKTNIAREIHRLSQRARHPLIELNCANLPEHLVEAELFGFLKGSFTGADHDRKGLFEEAHGGILFLDEVGDIHPSIQNRLLKAIDEKQIKRLGCNRYRLCDVQIIAATSRNLPERIQSGDFREDLYCRLAVLNIETTPLRDRREDIPAIITHFLRQASEEVSRNDNVQQQYQIEKDAIELLRELDYTGNIRALRNLVYELTSYVDDQEPISVNLVESALVKLNCRKLSYVGKSSSTAAGPANDVTCNGSAINSVANQISLSSDLEEGDILLPVDVRVLRRGETFKQWTARAKRLSIEAARQATGGTLKTAAERLAVSRDSLKNHLLRAKRTQNEALFDWKPDQ